MSSAAAPEESRRVPFRAGGFAPRHRPSLAWAAAVGLLAVWLGVSASGLVSPTALPGPASVAGSLWELSRGGELWTHLAVSLRRIGAGWLAGTAAGLAVGLAVGVSTVARSTGMPLVSALFPIPKIALLPLLILWLGIGELSKVATIALGVFFPTVVSAAAAIDAVPRNLVRMAQSFGLRPAAIWRCVLLPGALPGILSGFRISTSIALILMVAAEMIGAERGLGALILSSGHLMQTDRLLAGVLVLSAVGVLLGAALRRIEARALRWREA